MARISPLLVLLASVACAHALRPELQQYVDKALASRNDPESRAFATINGKEYFIGTEISLAWIDSIEFCNALRPVDGTGLALLSLETQTENDAMKQYLIDNGLETREFWISAQRLPMQQFLWTGTGQIGTFLDWAPGQPDLSQNYVCAQLSAAGWGDEECNRDQRYFICE